MNEKLGINPWLKIWVRPRETMRQIVAFNPRFRFILLSILYGLPVMLQFCQTLSLGEILPISVIFITAIIVAPWIGVIGISVFSALLLWVGKWLGGNGTYYTVRAAVSWAAVTNIASVLIWGLLIARFRRLVFFKTFPSIPFMGHDQIVVMVALIAQLVVSIWSFIIVVKALAEVQGFSSWRAVLNILIPVVMIMVLTQGAAYFMSNTTT